MVGVTVTLPSLQQLRLYNAHLWYKPEEDRQQKEVAAHVEYIRREDQSSQKGGGCEYEYVIWAGDFNNESMASPSMMEIGRA